MILPLKALAAAGLAASLATGGAIATRATSENRLVAAPAAASAAGGDDLVTPTTGGEVHDTGDDAGDDTTSTTTTATPAPATTPTVSVHDAGPAGTVELSVSGGFVTVTDVVPNPGWTVETERSAGREVEVTFRSAGHRIDFKAEFEDGRLETRVVDRTTGLQPEQPTATAPAPSVDDDHDAVDDDDAQPEIRDGGDTDDHSGPGRDGDGGDHSGPGGGDDDHSGSGGGDDSGHDG